MYWGAMHFGEVPEVVTASGETVKDLYTLVVKSYTTSEMWGIPGVVWVAVYVFSMIVLAFHLWHGFASAFQTLGVNHKRYTPGIKLFGKVFAVLIPLAFALIPVYVFITMSGSAG